MKLTEEDLHIDYKDPNFGGITCKCRSKNVRIITEIEIKEEGDEEKYFKVTKFKCLDCDNEGIYEKKELKIIDTTDEYVRFIEV